MMMAESNSQDKPPREIKRVLTRMIKKDDDFFDHSDEMLWRTRHSMPDKRDHFKRELSGMRRTQKEESGGMVNFFC